MARLRLKGEWSTHSGGSSYDLYLSGVIFRADIERMLRFQPTEENTGVVEVGDCEAPSVDGTTVPGDEPRGCITDLMAEPCISSDPIRSASTKIPWDSIFRKHKRRIMNRAWLRVLNVITD